MLICTLSSRQVRARHVSLFPFIVTYQRNTLPLLKSQLVLKSLSETNSSPQGEQKEAYGCERVKHGAYSFITIH